MSIARGVAAAVVQAECSVFAEGGLTSGAMVQAGLCGHAGASNSRGRLGSAPVKKCYAIVPIYNTSHAGLRALE